MSSRVAILIPAMRPHRLPDVVQSIQESTPAGEYRIVVIATGECAEVAKTLGVTLLEDEGASYPVRMNRAFAETTEPFVMCAADDLHFTPGWLEAVMRVMEQTHGVIAVNDKMNAGGVHFFIEREYAMTLGAVLDEPGHIFSTAYFHAFCDDETRATAQFHGRFAYALDSVVEHRHVGNGRAEMDEVYAMGNASMGPGLATYRERAHLWQKTE